MDLWSEALWWEASGKKTFIILQKYSLKTTKAENLINDIMQKAPLEVTFIVMNRVKYGERRRKEKIINY